MICVICLLICSTRSARVKSPAGNTIKIFEEEKHVMKKRLLAVFLAIAMMLSMASFGVAAETTNQADVEVVYLESKADLDSIDMMPGVVYI